MNEIRIEDKILPKFEEMGSFQIEGNKNLKMNII